MAYEGEKTNPNYRELWRDQNIKEYKEAIYDRISQLLINKFVELKPYIEGGNIKSLQKKGYAVSLHSKNEDYKNIVYQTLSFIKRELYEESTGCFYSSLDADSEGEEGKFYVWGKEELKKILNNNFEVFSEYYRINSSSLWE